MFLKSTHLKIYLYFILIFQIQNIRFFKSEQSRNQTLWTLKYIFTLNTQPSNYYNPMIFFFLLAYGLNHTKIKYITVSYL